jgi:ABC-type glycerol-3-phosphate transport system substrate-binding protein
MRRKIALALVSLAAALLLAGCAAVNDENSFQNLAPGEVAATQAPETVTTDAPAAQAQPGDTAQTAAPEATQEPETPALTDEPGTNPGYNG